MPDTQPTLDRRSLLARAAALPVTATAAALVASRAATAQVPETHRGHIKTSCNLFSFNGPLLAGEMTIEDVIDICSDLGFDAIDPTGYYFTGYPAVPSAQRVHWVKMRAYRKGLAISGTGVRNDFTRGDDAALAADIHLVRDWIDVARELGAPSIRVFAGAGVPDGMTRARVVGRMVDALRECAAYGASRGVMISFQNHNDVFTTAEQTLAVLDAVGSEWMGLNVDIGSLRTTDDPYREIAMLAPHAITWQIKEDVYRGGRPESTDLRRVVGIIRDSGYRGYVPLETLRPGDPREHFPRFARAFLEALG